MDFAPLSLQDRDAWADLLAVSFDRTPQDMTGILDRLCAQYPVIAWGAWDGNQLAAQYSCLLIPLHIPAHPAPVFAGMSINMAVHPTYRGQGLIKHLARPVYDEVTARGGVAGVGFSNAEGVKVDRRSKSYGYQVVGKMQPSLALLLRRPHADPLRLTDRWPDVPLPCPDGDGFIRFAATPESNQYKYIGHPSRRYAFAVWEAGDQVRGVVAYRITRWHGLRMAALLAVCGADQAELIARWAAAMHTQGVRLVHLLTTPTSPIRAALRKVTLSFPLPYSRSPYYLTVKPLHDDFAPLLLDFARWDCIGGDIL